MTRPASIDSQISWIFLFDNAFLHPLDSLRLELKRIDPSTILNQQRKLAGSVSLGTLTDRRREVEINDQKSFR